MSAAAVMAVVFFLFFLVGVAVGVLVVIAVSARRAHKAVPQVAPSPKTWPYHPGPGPDEGGPDEPPWWRARGGD
ncbi:MAG: hypothetical protein ACRDPD_26500 [Streptosporangiaceae bacterium]